MYLLIHVLFKEGSLRINPMLHLIFTVSAEKGMFNLEPHYVSPLEAQSDSVAS